SRRTPRGARGEGSPLRGLGPVAGRAASAPFSLGRPSSVFPGAPACVGGDASSEGVRVNIAVIGGAGFVGSALVRRLHPEHKVTVFDNFSRGAHINLPVGVKVVSADAMDGIPSLHGFDWVYDFAARVYGVRDLYNDPARLLADNIRITTASLEAVVLAKVPNYFYVSSSCV